MKRAHHSLKRTNSPIFIYVVAKIANKCLQFYFSFSQHLTLGCCQHLLLRLLLPTVYC